jgi:hypothetical protein
MLQFACKCKGEPGSRSCWKPTNKANTLCEDCMKGRHGHDYYRHLDLDQSCFYAKDEQGKTVCVICTSNSETLLRK